MSFEVSDMARRFSEIEDAVSRISQAARDAASREANIAESVESVFERVYQIEGIFGVFEGFMQNVADLLTDVSRTLPNVRELEEQVRNALAGVDELRSSNAEAISTVRGLLTDFRRDVSDLTSGLEESKAHVEMVSKTNTRIEQRMNEVESSLSKIRAEIPNIAQHVASADKSAFTLAQGGKEVVESSVKVVGVVDALSERVGAFDQATKDTRRQVAEVSKAVEALPGVIDDVSRQATVDIAMQIMRDLDFSELLENATRQIVSAFTSQVGAVADSVRRIDGRMADIEEAMSNRRGLFGPKK